MGDPAAPPFPRGYTGNAAAREAAMKNFILSASGWRRVFAADDEARGEEIDLIGKEFAAAAAEVFADFLVRRFPKARRLSPALGIDSRFTGPVIAEVMLRVFLARGFKPRYLFIVSSPEIMAWTAGEPGIHGFAYVSASHNPVGHNGFKFGLGGSVLGGGQAWRLAEDFRALTSDKKRMSGLINKISTAAKKSETKEALAALFSEAPHWKNLSRAAYEAFILRVITGKDKGEAQTAMRVAIGKAARGRGIVIDFNGSSRCLGIDKNFLESFGLVVKAINARPREITHAVEPDGQALEQCRDALIKANKHDPRFIFGYVPDNDGDRGNIVFYDEAARVSRILSAQEVFALACFSELAFARNNGRLPPKTAVVVNDATSLRIERIAESFGAKVFRAETGEANVVALARKLRSGGWTVRITGEGSNGGNITWPSEVRDPLSTVFAILKLLFGDNNPAAIKKGRRKTIGHPQSPLRHAIEKLPRFLTLGTTANEARLNIRSKDHGALKERYEAIFLREWEARKNYLMRYGISGWEELNYEGTVCRRGMGRAYRTGRQSGGLSMLLKDKKGAARAFLWMRGSGTEPIYRISVDVEGDKPQLFQYLIDWQTAMVREAGK